MSDAKQYLNYIRNSREFALGSALRQSIPFKLLRHFRFRNRHIRFWALSEAGPRSSAKDVCLLGVWYEEYPFGMPLELLERNTKKWRMIEQESSPYGKALLTAQKDVVYIYSLHENLRLDFRMDASSGKIKIAANEAERVIDLYSKTPAVLSVYPNRGQIEALVNNTIVLDEATQETTVAAPPGVIKKTDFTAEDLQWLEKQSRHPKPLSLNNPAWMGILASASELFENIYTIPDSLNGDRAAYYARLFAEAGVPSITIQGFPHTYIYLVKALRRIASHLPLYVIYHGNFLHMREDYDWSVFKTILELHKNREVAKIGFVKKGMAEIMSAVGVRSAFIMNRVRKVPEGASTPLDGGPHLAIWSQPDWFWKKSPYAMLASLRLIPGAIGHTYNVSPRAKEFGDLMGVSSEYLTEALPRDQVFRIMERMHLNLYISFTECAPMIPLECLSVGSPCLFGPTTHYFLDHPYLHSRLVVPYPDHAEVIAEKANLALQERDEIIRAYRDYAPEYNRRASQALSDFLEFPVE